MTCQGCGAPVDDEPFCPFCGRRLKPTDGIPEPGDRGPQYRVVYGRKPLTRLWLLLVAAMLILLGSVGVVLVALRGS